MEVVYTQSRKQLLRQGVLQQTLRENTDTYANASTNTPVHLAPSAWENAAQFVSAANCRGIPKGKRQKKMNSRTVGK